MIRLKKIEIHVNEEFKTERQLNAFKAKITAYVARNMANAPTVYNSFETHENKLILNK